MSFNKGSGSPGDQLAIIERTGLSIAMLDLAMSVNIFCETIEKFGELGELDVQKLYDGLKKGDYDETLVFSLNLKKIEKNLKKIFTSAKKIGIFFNFDNTCSLITESRNDEPPYFTDEIKKEPLFSIYNCEILPKINNDLQNRNYSFAVLLYLKVLEEFCESLENNKTEELKVCTGEIVSDTLKSETNGAYMFSPVHKIYSFVKSLRTRVSSICKCRI